MSKSVTFRADEAKLQVLDHLAEAMQRDRSYLINEAVDQYLEVQQWHAAQIQAAIVGADAGEFATDQEVGAAFAAFRSKP